MKRKKRLQNKLRNGLGLGNDEEYDGLWDAEKLKRFREAFPGIEVEAK